MTPRNTARSRQSSRNAIGRRRRGVWGGMLVDAMCAMTVGTLVLMTTTTLFTTSYVSAYGARYNNTAYNAARHVIENIRTGYGSSVATATNQSATYYGAVPELGQLPSGTGTVTISNWSNSASTATGTSVKCIAVTISWYDGHQTRSLTVSSLITAGGVSLQ